MCVCVCERESAEARFFPTVPHTSRKYLPSLLKVFKVYVVYLLVNFLYKGAPYNFLYDNTGYLVQYY